MFIDRSNKSQLLVFVIGLMAVLLVALAVNVPNTVASAAASTSDPDFGPNVLIFDPSMLTSDIQAAVDAIRDQQVDNEMGTERYALLFKPGTYGSATEPLWLQVGYYTEVAGLGALPTDVQINGHVDVYNRCLGPNNTNCLALNNFWRSLSNLTINVTGKGVDGCRDSGNFWAASQAAPMRRVNITGGNLTLMDYCTAGPQYASGGFIADSQTQFVINGSQQQYLVRNSSFTGWSNGVWNQVFSGVDGAPGECFPADPSCGGNPYTTLPTTELSRERPFLYIDNNGDYQVFVPDAQQNTSGVTWASGQTPGQTIPLDDFLIITPDTELTTINFELKKGKHLLLTPGIYEFKDPIKVKEDNTVVLGLGLPTLVPTKGKQVMRVYDVEGVNLAGFMIDAGLENSQVLLEIGTTNPKNSDPGNPTTLSDIFVRIGGAIAGKSGISILVNSDNVLIDNAWIWRADHGNPGTVGWEINQGKTGLVVKGDDVTATGLFVEHYQEYNVIWEGNGGSVVFFQNELAYDPPSQAEWTSEPGVNGWAALKVDDDVTSFSGIAMASYSFFNQGVDIYNDNAFEVPSDLPAGSLHNLLTVFLDPTNGAGGILNVVNGIGGSSTIANPSVAVTVVNYP